MIVVSIFKENAGSIAGFTSAINFENRKKWLGLYFSNLKKIKEKILAGEIIDIPYLTLQKDRRVNKKEMIRNERRKNLEMIVMPIKFSEKELYSVKELEKILPITPLTIREYIRKGKIKGSKIGKNWYVKKQDLEAFLEGKDQ